MKKKEKLEIQTEKDYNLYVKGFEDGYATAKRIYKLVHIYGTNESNETLKLTRKNK